ncbi:MAG: serine/threonine-protein kinase [Akkermansiaceae bacterium]
MTEPSFQAPSPQDLADLLPQFDVEFFIAQGGMGAVYKGRQRSLDRDVAIKVLPKEMGANEEFRESFTTEAKAMAKLNHPNLLGVFDFGSVDGMPYIVMEYVEGGSLYEACYEQAVDSEQAVAIVLGICRGLSDAHEHDIVHRDIKPANILLTEKIEPKVADFGLAQAIDSDQPGLVMGTPGYTAPEVFQDPEQSGKLADIYSVGVILHQLLTGINPSGSMEPPTEPTSNLRLDAIWRKATNIVPTQRYATVAAMADDLEKWASAVDASNSGATPVAPPANPQQSSGVGVKVALVSVFAVGLIGLFNLLPKEEAKIVEKNLESENEPAAKVIEVLTEPEKVVEPRVDFVPETTVKNVNPVIPEITEPEVVMEVEKEEPEDILTSRPEKEKIPEKEPEVLEEPELDPGDPELRQKAIGLIEELRKKRNTQLAENSRWFTFQLGIHGRNAEFDAARMIKQLEKRTSETRIPSKSGAGIIPFTVREDFQRATDKEESIDREYLSGLKSIRDAYVNRLSQALGETSDDQLKKRLAVQAERAEDLEAWVRLLNPDPEKSPKMMAKAFVGNWDVHSYDKVTRWIAHGDGRMEAVGERWRLRWEILKDGTLVVKWPRAKKPYILTQDENGQGWTGKTSFGKDVQLKAGDW